MRKVKLILLAIFLTSTFSTVTAKRPNVLFILTDQWRAQATGYAGDPNVKTPNIDQLAKQGVNFRTAVSVCAICTPYRAALQTGRFPLSTGMYINDLYLDPDDYCMAEIFKDAGYQTAYVGKWHLDGHGRQSYIPPERRQGYDYWKVLECTHDYQNSMYYEGDDPEAKHWEGYDVYAQTRDAQQYIRAHASDEKPFLYVLAYGAPHFPHGSAPEDLKDLYPPESLTLRPNVPPEMAESARKELQGYYAHCTAIDRSVGELLKTLSETGIAENTIVVFTSDHGEMMGSHGIRPFQKRHQLDESILVPFLLSYPQLRGTAGRTVNTPLNTPDILPTLLGLSEIEIPETIEGEDLSVLVREPGKEIDRAALTMQVRPYSADFPVYRGIRTARYWYSEKPGQEAFFLFDLENDPYQTNNLVGKPEFLELQKKMEQRLKEELIRIGDYPFKSSEGYDAHNKRRTGIDKKGRKIEGKGLAQKLEGEFKNPPESARPYTFYFFMNGQISKPGITRDLEAFAATGVGGLMVFDINWHTPHGGVYYDSDEFHSALGHMMKEASRLGLDISIKNCSGWSSTGASWVTPEQSMKKLSWSEQSVKEGQNGIQLEKPEALLDFYRDIAVLAFPSPENVDYRLDNWFSKALDDEKTLELAGKKKMGDIEFLPSFGEAPAEATIALDEVVDISDKMDESGRLNWSPKSGKWTVIRFGYTTTGRPNGPASDGAKGLEIDKMSRPVAELYWKNYLDKIVAYGKNHNAFSAFHIDSYEAGHQNWTENFDVEFRKRCGYDLIPRLLCVTGRILESTDYSERVLWDLRRTAADLTFENYYRYFTQRCHEYGLKMVLEPYGWGSLDAPRVAQLADIPVSEFWQPKAHDPWSDAGFQWSTQLVASAAHLTGKKVVGAEAYTRMKGDWTMHPYVMKIRGDRFFARGINRIIFHSTAHNPFPDEVKPGMTMGQFGFQSGRNNTWFYESTVWKQYLTRCQSVFQKGEYVTDMLYLYGDERGYNCWIKGVETIPPESWLPGNKFDLADLGTIDRLFVDETGKVRVRHEGKALSNAYEMLVMKRSSLMTPETAQRLGKLAEQGAKIYCDRPVRTPHLHRFEENDKALAELVKKYWDSGKILPLTALDAEIAALTPDCEMADEMQYAHHRIGAADFYFVSNQTYDARDEKVTFRVSDKLPELWDPETGETMPAPNWRLTQDGRTQVDLELGPAGSMFVVFRKPTDQKEGISPKMEYEEVATLSGGWTLAFDPVFGPDEAQVFDKLIAWNEHPDKQIKHFSGTATYRKTFELADPDQSLCLDLGEVQVMARVIVNGKDLGVLWKPPFRMNLSGALKKGNNRLEVRVTNLWVNRLIGDSSLPETGQRSKWKSEAYERFPDWVLEGTPVPIGQRRTFAPWNHYDKGGKLVPSGLIGPVRLMEVHEIK